ncbi:EamA family transporter RarD [Enterococcus devriesei]|uniref:EamA family transporter RarD n=1 Tax=Enterococcus devriesei TaxID=319970 RepID=UPI0028927CE0|nr:EamA family transporter RarD [Enterococcus devriesei]MDT2822374.1 EamA family transporter RarD [Enterococcus devriesei]
MCRTCLFILANWLTEGIGSIKKGLIYGVITYTIWGFLPIFWKLLEGINSLELLVYRIIWSFLVMSLTCLCFFKKEMFVEQLLVVWRDAKVRWNLCLAALSIGGNWGAFIYCVASGQTNNASFAYFCSPLFTVFFGHFLFKERLNVWQRFAVVLLMGSIFTKLFTGASLSFVPLLMALAVAYYGVLEKQGALNPIFRMWVETVILLPVALMIMWFTKMPLVLPMLGGNLLLATSGAATALPLILFMAASKRLPQTVLAILQYLNPALMLAVSVFLFREPWHPSDLLTYSWVLVGSIVFVIGLMQYTKEEEKHDKRRSSIDSVSDYQHRR